MIHRLFVAPLLCLVPLSILGRVSEASAEPAPCTTYSIDGTMNDEREATALLHLADEPLVGHQVFVVFAGADIELPPSVLVTGPDGTVTVAVPDGANTVSFSAESPVGGACSGATSTEERPDTVPEVVVVSDTVWRPGSELAEPSSTDVVTSPPPGSLAVTGPTSPAVSVAAGLVLVAGWFAHRLRGSDRPDRGAPACRFPGIPL